MYFATGGAKNYVSNECERFRNLGRGSILTHGKGSAAMNGIGEQLRKKRGKSILFPPKTFYLLKRGRSFEGRP